VKAWIYDIGRYCPTYRYVSFKLGHAFQATGGRHPDALHHRLADAKSVRILGEAFFRCVAGLILIDRQPRRNCWRFWRVCRAQKVAKNPNNVSHAVIEGNIIGILDYAVVLYPGVLVNPLTNGSGVLGKQTGSNWQYFS
jgi:hypothetical protein